MVSSCKVVPSSRVEKRSVEVQLVVSPIYTIFRETLTVLEGLCFLVAVLPFCMILGCGECETTQQKVLLCSGPLKKD